jgi:hypothetical protein
MDFPWVNLLVEISGKESVVAVNAAEAAAMAFIPGEDAFGLFTSLCGVPGLSGQSREVADAAKRLDVWKWAVLRCARDPSSGFDLPRKADAVAKGEITDEMRVHEIAGRPFETYYAPILVEKHRSPARGGNAKALHSHALVIDGEKYIFKALGSKKWAYVGDLVSFKYVISGGHRLVLKNTFATVDAKGAEVVRGERGFKRTLRTAAQRMPGSKREQR